MGAGELAALSAGCPEQEGDPVFQGGPGPPMLA